MRLLSWLKPFTGQNLQDEASSRSPVTNKCKPAPPRVERDVSLNPALACDNGTISKLVDQLTNTPPNQLNFKAIEKVLAEPRGGFENKIWYGVCLHMQNKRAEVTLRDIDRLTSPPRDVIVALAVEHILHGDSSSGLFSDFVDTISKHNLAHQKDRFSRLLESLLIYHRDGTNKALPIIEKLYLDHRTYSPGLSVMASYMFQQSIFPAATDFAKEALGIDKDNFQARAVISYQNIFESKKSIKDAFSHASDFLHPEAPDSILFCRYAMLDPK